MAKVDLDKLAADTAKLKKGRKMKGRVWVPPLVGGLEKGRWVRSEWLSLTARKQAQHIAAGGKSETWPGKNPEEHGGDTPCESSEQLATG